MLLGPFRHGLVDLIHNNMSPRSMFNRRIDALESLRRAFTCCVPESHCRSPSGCCSVTAFAQIPKDRHQASAQRRRH